MFGSLRYSAARMARRTGFTFGGLVFMFIGLGFLTVAAWIYLAETHDTLMAALVIGCAYFGVGLVLMALAGRSRPVPMAHPAGAPPPAAGSMTGIMAALMQGVGAGIAAGGSRPAPPPPPRAPGE